LETVDELSTEADKLKLEVQDLQICNEETASKLELSTEEVKRLQESTVMIAALQKQQTESEQIIAELEKDLEESKGLVQVAKVEVTDNNHDALAIKDEEITRLKNELKMLRQISPTNQKELSGLPEDPLDSEEMEVLKDELKEANKKITILQKRVSRSNSSSAAHSLGMIQVVALKKELEEAQAVISRLKEQPTENQAASESTSESEGYRVALANANKEIERLQKALDGFRNPDKHSLSSGTFTPDESSTDPIVSVLEAKLTRKMDELKTLTEMLDDSRRETVFERNRWQRSQQTNLAVMEEIDELSEAAVRLNRLLKAEIANSRQLQEELSAAKLELNKATGIKTYESNVGILASSWRNIFTSTTK